LNGAASEAVVQLADKVIIAAKSKEPRVSHALHDVGVSHEGGWNRSFPQFAYASPL
jgi:hypothetical protein